MNTLTIGTTLIAWMPIPENHDGTRRQAERSAVGEIVRRLYGPGSVIDHTPDGAPVLAGEGLVPVCISVSHSRDLAVVAVDPHSQIGVDAETPRPTLQRVREKFLTTAEMELFTTPELLLGAWTAKEAVYKACGVPSLMLTDISVSPGQDTATATGRDFALHRLTVGDDMITLATPAND